MDLLTDFYPLYNYIKKHHKLLDPSRFKCEPMNWYDNPRMFLELKPLEQTILIAWILNTLVPSKGINDRADSYQLKHRFSKSLLGFYISNGQFKGAMIIAGYNSKDMNNQNWHFNIRQSSITNLRKTNSNVISSKIKS